MSSAHKKTQQANEAVTRGGHEAFLSFCTDNTKWTFVGERTLEGKAAVREYMADAYKQPPRFHVERMIAEGPAPARAPTRSYYLAAQAPIGPQEEMVRKQNSQSEF